MLTGKRIAILVEDDFEDSELMEPLRTMRNEGATVTVVGGGKENYKGKKGTTIKPDAADHEVKAESFDAVIVPGGYAPDKMRLHQGMIDLVRTAHKAGKLVAAICHGPQLLISAGVVKNRRVTSWPSVAIDLENAGARWADEPVVRDGNLITSRKPSDIPQFNNEIIKTLGNSSK